MLEALAAPPPAPASPPSPAPAPSPNAKPASPPTAPAAEPKPTASAASKDKSGFDDDYKELQRLADGGEDEAPAAPESKPDNEDAELEKPEPAKKPADAPEPKTNAELRKVYQESKVRVAALESEVNLLKKPKPAEPDPELPKLKETLSAREKRLAEYEQEMRHVNYEKSEEYQEKFEKPKQKLLNDARETIQELIRTQADGTERAGEWKDFQDILLMEPLEASKTAKEWFGDAAPEVLAFRREYRKLNSERAATMEKYQKEFGEIEQQRTAKQQEHRANIQKLWTDTNKALVEKFGKFFAPVEGDDEGNKLLAQGFEKADAAFMQIENAKPEDVVRLHSEVRNMAAGFGRQVLLNQRLEKENVSLKEKLKQFEASVPRGGDGGAAKSSKDSFEDDWSAVQASR